MNLGENVTYTLGVNPKTGKPVAENVVGDGTGTPAPQGFGGGGRGGFGGGFGGGPQKPCFRFQQGNCTFGDRCRFSHGGGGGGGYGGMTAGGYGGGGRAPYDQGG